MSNNLTVQELSPDGKSVLAMTIEATSSGLLHSNQLVSIDAQTANVSVLAEAGSGGSFEPPASWSPDGLAVAYTYANDYEKNASLLASSKGADYSICVLQVGSDQPSCYPTLGSVYSFSWSPSGDQLAIGGASGQPLQLLDPSTGSSTELVPGNDPKVIDVFAQAGSDVSSVQFVAPAWSASGKYIATLGFADQAIPLIFTAEGQLVATGRANPDVVDFSWSPDQEVLAYDTGIFTPEPPTTSTWQVYLLSPTGTDQPIPTAESPIRALKWNPAGRWLAVQGNSEIAVVDTTDPSSQPAIVSRSIDSGQLVDWGP